MTMAMVRGEGAPNFGRGYSGGPDGITLDGLLAPVRPASFFSDYWERAVLVVDGRPPDYFSQLLTFTDIDRIVTEMGLGGDVISLVDAKRDILPEDYQFPSGMVDPVRVFDSFAGGATIILQQLHLRHWPLAQLCRAMEARFGHRFQTNIYVTPAGSAQGFKPHWDSHDVFVLQVAGSKDWKIYDTPIVLPDRTVAFDSKNYTAGEPTKTFTLTAGDLAYIPRGIVHDAVTTDEISVHITLGAIANTWRDLLHAAVDALSLRDEDVRRALPPGYHHQGDRIDADMTASFAALIGRLAADTDLGGLMQEFADDLLETRVALVPGQLEQVAGLTALHRDTIIRSRPAVISELSDEGDTVRLSVFGRELAFPAHTRPALEAALGAESGIAIADFPGPLDLEGRLVLVRRLIREGLVTAG